jgi:hypothetical protein
MSHLIRAVFALVTLTSVALPHTDKKKVVVDPRDVEVRLADKSRVRMRILQDELEIVTRYGKLTVPTSDVRRIEFGIHPTPDIAKKIEKAITRLGQKEFPEREAATNELIAIGGPAYLALYQASRSRDLEVANRAKAALARVRQKVPEDQLRVKDDDLIQTAEFSIVGKITATTIKATTPVFGEAQLRVSDLRSIRWLGSQAEVEVMIDGTKYAVAGNQWMDTGVELSLDDELAITASGQIDLMTNGGGGQYLTGPAGNGQWGGRNATGHPPGALLGRIGENGPTFLIGESYKAPSKREGKLYLQISPSPWAQNGPGAVTGNYKVNITGGRDIMDR